MVIDAERTNKVSYRSDTAGPRESSGRSAAQARRRDAGVERRPPSRQAKRVSAAKREERERRQRIIRARRIALVIGGAAVIGVCIWGAVALTSLPAFGVKAVRVEGTRHLDPSTVVALAGVDEGSSLIRLSKRGISRRVSADPWVERVRIDRDFPGTVRIIVTERTPSIAVDLGGAEAFIASRDGVWLGPRTAEESGVPTVRDVEIPVPKPGTDVTSDVVLNVIGIVDGLSTELLSMTRVISAPSIEKTALYTTDDVEVFIGDSVDIATKDRIVREILKKEKGKVVYINVRVVESPTWRGLDE